MVRKMLAVLVLLGVFGTLSAVSGCNTVAGAGQDIQSGGKVIRDEAKKVEKKM